jgi:hypothetical protein
MKITFLCFFQKFSLYNQSWPKIGPEFSGKNRRFSIIGQFKPLQGQGVKRHTWGQGEGGHNDPPWQVIFCHIY